MPRPARGSAVRPMMVNNRGAIVMTVLGPMMRPAEPVAGRIMIAAQRPVAPMMFWRAMVASTPPVMAPIPVFVRPGAARHQNKYRTHRNEPL